MQTMRQKGVNTLMALGFVAAMALTAGPAQAASGNEPYYAEPSWSQKLPTATRFVILTDWNSEAVLDRETGLVWEQSPQTVARDWFQARLTCIRRAAGGRREWRLPSVHELQSLIDPSVPSPGLKLPSGHPFANIQLANYWSSTAENSDLTNAWVARFSDSVNPSPVIGKSIELYAWCVRGGMNADAY